MKMNFKRIVLMLVVALSISALFTSCTPEEVDAFADGYRWGYYGEHETNDVIEKPLNE